MTAVPAFLIPHPPTVDLPAGATLLASSEAYPNQAFNVGSAYGLQFHLECPPELVETWNDIDAYRESLRSALGPDGPAILLEGLRAQFPQLAHTAQEVMTNWLDTYVLTVRRG